MAGSGRSTPRDDGPDIDAAFAEIVARLREPTPDPRDIHEEVEGRQPAARENPDAPDADPLRPSAYPESRYRRDPLADTPESPPSARTGPVPWRVDPTGSVADALLGDQDWEGSEDPDEHFVPGPTAPLPPRRDRTFWIALVGLTAGPALVLWVALVGPGGTAVMRLGILAMVAGFIALIVRQPIRRGDDPDNGARV